MYVPTASRRELLQAIQYNHIMDIAALVNASDEDLRNIITEWIAEGDECNE